jgi:hypothetical protein
MDILGRGYTDCKGTFNEQIQLAIGGIAGNFIHEVYTSRASKGKRYKLSGYQCRYGWICNINQAAVSVEIKVSTILDKYYVSMEFESCGLPCMFMLVHNPKENNVSKSWEYYHKGANPENAIIQGIYGRLVDHAFDMDYKDLDHV